MNNRDKENGKLDFYELVALLLENRISREERETLIEMVIDDPEKAEFLKTAIRDYEHLQPELDELEKAMTGNHIVRQKRRGRLLSFLKWGLAAALPVAIAAFVFVTGVFHHEKKPEYIKGMHLENVEIDTTIPSFDTDSLGADSSSNDSGRMDSLKTEEVSP